MRILNSTTSTENLQNKSIPFRITNIHLKIILIINYLLLLSTLIIILSTPPVDSYEFSIYGAYPQYFWFLLLLSIILGMISAILSILNDSLRKYWTLGFLAEIIAISLVLFLPLIRGYYIYGSGDILTHIGYMLDIEYSGVIGRNHYPILHILGVSLHETTTLSYGIITMIIPPIFSLISILYWYILGKEIMTDMREVVILVLVTALPIYGVVNSLFTPNHQAFLLIPLIIYSLIKYQTTKRKEIGIIFIVLSILMAIIHPLIAVMIIFMYCLIQVSNYLFLHFFSDINERGSILKIIFIMAAVFSMWSTYLIFFINAAKPLTASLLGTDEVQSEIAAKFDLISRVDIDIVYLMNLGLHVYGICVILSLSALLCISFLFFRYFKEREPVHRYLSIFIVCFIVFFNLGIIVFLKLDLFGMKRIFNFALLFALIIIFSTIIKLHKKLQFSKIITQSFFCVLIVIAIILLVYLSVFSVHLSPFIKMSNQQVTEGNYIGMSTFFEKRDVTNPIMEYGLSQMRYFDSIYGRNMPTTNIRYGEITSPIDHFGYNASPYLGSNYDQKHYFLLSKEGRGFYESMYPEFPDKWRFTDTDFQMLETDPSVARIFTNENLNIYLIKQTFQQFGGVPSQIL